MPTPDQNNVLFKIAHPDLYERNPFNVLNLPVDATAKDIRRRKEDIEAAFDAGTEAAEFANILPGDETRKTPTRTEVDELFATLEDPEKRIAYALFWQWPERPNDETPDKTRKNPNYRFGNQAVLDGWEKIVGRYDTSVEVRHNVAVINHMMGLAYERSLLTNPGWRGITPGDVSVHWQKAIRWWNAVSDNADCWHFVADLISSLNDPRLNYRFARSLKEQFAFAFDQINVELAVSFAKMGRESDAKRQVQYMRLSQPESDDVEGTFDDAFAGLLRQTEAIVRVAETEARKNPESGLVQSNNILERTREQLYISRIVLKKGTSIRNAIVSTIFSGIRSCLIAYGNKSRDWEQCLAQTGRLRNLAETQEQLKLVEQDEKIIRGNLEETLDSCGLCGRKIQSCETGFQIEVPFHGEIRPKDDLKSVSYQTVSLNIPICSTCKQSRRLTDRSSFLDVSDIVVNPEVQTMLSKGWRLGSQMSQSAIGAALWSIQARARDKRYEAELSASFGRAANALAPWAQSQANVLETLLADTAN